MKTERPSFAGLVIALLFVIAALARWNRPPTHNVPATACGPMQPVTIGGSMVVGCR